MSRYDAELRDKLRVLPRTDRYDERYPIDAYEDDLIKLIEYEVRAATEDTVIRLLSVTTEGLFDNGELFIKRKPIEQEIINMFGYEKFRAIQEAIDTPEQTLSPNQEQQQ